MIKIYIFPIFILLPLYSISQLYVHPDTSIVEKYLTGSSEIRPSAYYLDSIRLYKGTIYLSLDTFNTKVKYLKNPDSFYFTGTRGAFIFLRKNKTKVLTLTDIRAKFSHQKFCKFLIDWKIVKDSANILIDEAFIKKIVILKHRKLKKYFIPNIETTYFLILTADFETLDKKRKKRTKKYNLTNQ
jgi:hypothetical protein